MPSPLRLFRLAPLAAALGACSHAHPAAGPVDESALKVTVEAEPRVALGQLVEGSVPLASLYNVTQAARGEQVASILAETVSHETLHDGLLQGARARLPALHAAPGAAVQVAVERWGISAALPSDPGALQVTVQARLLGQGAPAVYTRPITCSVELHALAGTSPEQGIRHADRMLDSIPSGALSQAASALAEDCGARALGELAAR